MAEFFSNIIGIKGVKESDLKYVLKIHDHFPNIRVKICGDEIVLKIFNPTKSPIDFKDSELKSDILFDGYNWQLQSHKVIFNPEIIIEIVYLRKESTLPMITALIMTGALNWQTAVRTNIIQNNDFLGATVKVCVNDDCLTVDRSEETQNRAAEKDGGPQKEDDTPPPSGSGGMTQVLTTVLDKVGGGHGSITVDYKDTTKGDEHTVEVHVTVSGGTGSGK